MMRRTVWRSAGTVAVLVTWLIGAPAFADTFSECVERAYAKDVAAKQDWHRSLRDLTANGKPDLGELASLDMNQQLARIDQRQAQFSYLVFVDPRRIRTREGLATFRNFDWREADALTLRQRNPSYVSLERHVAELGRRTQGHPDWPELQEYSRSVLSVSPQFQSLLERLQERESDVERILKGCPSPR